MKSYSNDFDDLGSDLESILSTSTSTTHNSNLTFLSVFVVNSLQLVEDPIHHLIVTVQDLRLLLMAHFNSHFFEFIAKSIHKYITVFQLFIRVEAVFAACSLTV